MTASSIALESLDGSNEAINQVLDFAVEKTLRQNLISVEFKNWSANDLLIEPKILEQLSVKASKLCNLTVGSMEEIGS